LKSVAPHAGAWIETKKCGSLAIQTNQVAPHAGAWIETAKSLLVINDCVSRPMRARGLKHLLYPPIPIILLSRPMRARGLKPESWRWFERYGWSRPMRARGLKPCAAPCKVGCQLSRPMRARGLKQQMAILVLQIVVAPHGARGLKQT